MLTMTAPQLSRRAGLLIARLRRSAPGAVTYIKHAGESSAGGGSFPCLSLATALIEVRIEGFSAGQIEAALRRTTTPVIGRIQRERFLLDVRTILDSDFNALSDSLNEAATALIRNDK